MTSSCDPIHEQLAAECAAERPWSASLEAHLVECAGCAERARRLAAGVEAVRGLVPVPAPEALADLVGASFGAGARERRVAARLSALERAEAPAELEGRVVAACQRGHREDRVVAELRGVAGPGAPTELDGRLEGLFASLREEGLLGAAEAPRELDERVERDLADLPAAVSGHLLHKLPRVEAPEGLVERVDRRLAPAGGPRALRRPALTIGLAAAAALVLFATLQGPATVTPSGGEAPEPLALDSNFDFEVQRPGDLDQLSPRGRELYARFSGGLAPAGAGSTRVAIEPEGPSAAARRRDQDEGLEVSGGSGGRTSGAGAGAGAPTANGGSQASTSSGGPGGSASSAGGAGGLGFDYIGPDYFQRIGSAPFTVAFRGDRVVTVRSWVLDVVHEVEYREEVAGAGDGRFAIVPLQVLAPLMTFADGADFLLSQESREGFFFRFRDFRVRDWSAFQINYEVQDLAQTEQVAGVTCERFEIRRRDGSGDVYRVAIDPQTALVLAEEVLRPSGELAHSARFETLQLGADLSDLQLNDGVSAWTETDLAGLGTQLQGELLVPVAPPSGYTLQSIGVQAAAGLNQTPWAQLTYGDGVDTTFFLFEDGLSGLGNGSAQTLTSQQGDSVQAYSFGAWSMIEGTVHGRHVLAVGRVPELELLLMLQSAVE